MQRKDFLKGMALLPVLSAGNPPLRRAAISQQPVDFSISGNHVTYHSAFQAPSKVIFIADTHLWHSDQREEPYRQYSQRMAGAYNKTIHFKTGRETNPKESFEKTIAYAVSKQADLLILGGDIFSFPSEAAIAWALDQLAAAKLPFIYTAGNHDWHYEGMEGTSEGLRGEWTKRRLHALYQNESPLMACRDIKGIRYLVFDNSTNEINKAQLDFLEQHLQVDKPVVLAMHIPLYIPGASIHFGCGHPDWGADTDPSYQPERRPRWPKEGHTTTTMTFHKQVFEAFNIIGIFAGHVHEQSLGVYKGIPQYVVPANAAGGFYEIDFLPR